LPSPDIRTPDQRVRVFVSSTMGELSAEREAARAAIEQLRLAPVMFDAGASPHPPESLYRAYLDQSDVFVGIYWQRYGWVGPGMSESGLEDEFRLSAGLPRLLYLKRPAPDTDPGLRRMLDEIKSDGHVSYKVFSTPEQLSELLLSDLAAVLAERFAVGRGEVHLSPVPSPVSPLVGRDHDVGAVTRLVEEEAGRLVVLTGTGGIGKTRVALAVADRSGPHWNDGVAFVDLSAVTDPGSVAEAIASALGVVARGREQPLDGLERRLAGRSMLLVLDNFEQVLDAAPVVAELLERAPGLHVLVTSRAVLRIRGEREWRVGPLGLAPANASLAALTEAPAVRLFCDRARDVRPGFELTDDNATAVAELCRRLDGLPLALELAAAWTRLLAPQDILDQLYERVERPGALADLPDRQQTLTATMEWSYELLPETAQRFLAALSVFAGPFSVAGAQAVAGETPSAGPVSGQDDGSGAGRDHGPDANPAISAETLECLSVLLDHSMLNPGVRPDGQSAFQLLEVVRRFASGRLQDREAALERLERYLLAVLEDVSVRHGSQDWATRQIDSEQPNLQTVLRWAAARRRPVGDLLRGIGDAWVWLLARPNSELGQLIESFGAAGLESESDWMAWYWLRLHAFMLNGHHEQAAALIDQIPPQVRKLASGPRQGLILMIRAISRPYAPDSPARAELERSLAMLRDADDPLGLGYVMSHFGILLCLEGDVARARALHEQIIPIARRLEDGNQLAEAHYDLALDALAEGDLEPVYPHLAAAVGRYQHIDHREGLCRCLSALGCLAVEGGDAPLAARIVGASLAVREAVGLEPWPSVAESERRTLERIAALLSDDQFREQVEAGRRQDLDTALAQAMSQLAQPKPA
jgi:tetratricopeptide (TPR) repeat protein